MIKKKFKCGDYIMYRGNKYEITKVSSNWYDVTVVPPHDWEYVTGIGPGGEDDMYPAPKNMQMTVAELIYELKKFNPYAKVCGGDNFNNRIAIGWSGDDGVPSKSDCKYVCLDVAGSENKEQEQ